MSESTEQSMDQVVNLTPETPEAAPKLAVVTPGPRTVKVQVQGAKVVAPQKDALADDAPAEAAAPDEADHVVKKGELLDQIVAATGVKRADAKAVAEALLAALSDHLQADTPLQLPPLGKLRVVKCKDVGQGGKALTVKIRTPNPD